MIAPHLWAERLANCVDVPSVSSSHHFDRMSIHHVWQEWVGVGYKEDVEDMSHQHPYCSKYGNTVQTLPINWRTHLNRPPHRLVCGHQYTSHSSFYHISSPTLQANALLSTMRSLVCWHQAVRRCPELHHSQLCRKHPLSWETLI